MAFMEAEMTDKQPWYEVDGPYGTEWVPEWLVGKVDLPAAYEHRPDGYRVLPTALVPFCENDRVYNRPDALRRVIGYGVRWSAPGYMDSTGWTVFTNNRAAERYIRQEEAECRE